MSKRQELIEILEEMDHRSISASALVSYLMSRGFIKLNCTREDLTKAIKGCRFILDEDTVSLSDAGSIDDIKECIRCALDILDDILKYKYVI